MILQQQRGLSLLEALISLALLSIAFLGLIKLQSNLIVANDLSKQRMQAISYAVQKIEELRSYDALSASDSNNSYEAIASGSDTLTAANTTYTREWTVSSNNTLNYKNVTVVVSWTDRRNHNYSVTQSSIIGRDDPQTSGKNFTD